MVFVLSVRISNRTAAGIVHAVAAELSAKPSQVALAWLLSKGQQIVPIPGTKRRSYLEDNLAADTIRLQDSQLARLDAAMAAEKVSGARYAAWIMATVDR